MRVNKMNAAIVCDGREGVNCLNVATTVATTMLLISKSVIPEFENFGEQTTNGLEILEKKVEIL